MLIVELEHEVIGSVTEIKREIKGKPITTARTWRKRGRRGVAKGAA